MSVIIYHNPRCSKSRQTLALIEERGIKPEVIEYLKTPPSVQEFKRILKLLGMTPRDLIRKRETAYHEAGLDNPNLTTDDLIHAMVTYPILIERPIVVAGGKAILGRPPENVLAIL